MITKKNFSAKNVLLCTWSLELKTDSRSALSFRFYNGIKCFVMEISIKSGPYQILTSIYYLQLSSFTHFNYAAAKIIVFVF